MSQKILWTTYLHLEIVFLIKEAIKRMAGENTMKQNLNEKMQKRRIYKKCH